MSLAPLDPAALGGEFVRINQAITAANDPAAWQPAAEALTGLLERIEAALQDGSIANWPPADSAKVISILLTIAAEYPQYRHETVRPTHALISGMEELRRRALGLSKLYFLQPAFTPLAQDFKIEIFPLLDDLLPGLPARRGGGVVRAMPFRVIHVGNIAERLMGFRVRTEDAFLKELLLAIYQRKYLRFGTSGVRGRWQRDFTETRARQVVQAVCDFLKAENFPPSAGAEDLSGRRIVIGYDSRRNAHRVASWAAEVCLANGFQVDMAYRDTPTPALIYYETEYLDPAEVAGAINCTASHNPPEWQGIKFNPRLGYPAPTNVTDAIASRLNEIQLTDRFLPSISLEEAEQAGKWRGFDPIADYTAWIQDNGHGNARIPVDFERIRRYFGDRLVIVDEMHGASRGYLPRLLGEIGVRFSVLHPQTDPRLPGLEYANPEEPFNAPLKEAVRQRGAILGLGMDTDADRFGVVDQGGVYFRPNQILPMLVRYLGVDRRLQGRVIATQTGSPLLEVLAGKIPGNEAFKPAADVIPAYVDHPFYQRSVGRRESRVYKHTFMVPVGIKYIEEQRRTDNRYKSIKDQDLPANWRDMILIGGEESSGLTTRGHITDKDGIWANLLIMDMIAYYGTRPEKPLHSLAEIWAETCALEGCRVSYGGREPESNTGRSDVDAILEAKEDLLNTYLDSFGEGQDNTLAGMELVYAGGVRYDVAEMQLRDESGNEHQFLRVRSSGTEPINRIYVEATRPETARRLMQTVLNRLEELIGRELRQAQTEWRLVDILTVTKLTEPMAQIARQAIAEKGWSMDSVLAKLQRVVEDPEALEGRNRRMTARWIEALR